ncbi:penicillin-binding protein [Candidatus Marinamargulisbacteria bacterium SCGC AAA071-K20]|nr:penicillin-binding protein [Candidatus Marinamargulisbacteria bacterium SCGC AAA071-K20]
MVKLIFRSRYSIGKLTRSSGKSSVGARFQARKDKQRKLGGFLKKLSLFFFTIGFIGFIVLSIVIFNISRKLPDVETISTYIPAETTKIISEDNVVLAELHLEENRVLIPIEKISPEIQKAVVAMEDSNYYDHHGLDFKGIFRALVKDIMAGGFVQGGSTLTQQLARNLFLHRQRTIVRKLAEAILAVQIERKYTKTEILEMYLNQVYWGHNAYGIESASRMYYQKPAQNLNLAESALLVGILTGPELYSPIRNFRGAKVRQKLVLDRMVDLDIITKQESNIAYTEEIIIAKRKKFRYKAPFFTSFIIKQLIEMYGEEAAYTSGMRVHTTLNYGLQEHAEKTVKKYIEYGQSPKWVKGQKVASLNYEQGAILAIDPRTGYIKAMQGGADFQNNEFNRVTQSKRQPGSAFKPFLYLSALQKGFSPGSFIEDSPVTFNTIEGPYGPKNYTQKYLGNIPMRKAFERSVNVIAIKLNYLIGPETVVENAKKLGITSPLKPILSLPLGANEVTMLELGSAYGVFANNGKRVEPTGIISIEDRDGTPLYEHKIVERRVFNANLIATLVDMMKGIVKYGTGRNAKLPRPVAGKTGTTSDYRDAWFVGFVPQLVCITWVGNDNNTPTYKMTGGWVPASMWREFMKEALRKVPPQDFPRPKGLVQRKVNWKTGKLATDYSPEDSVTTEKYWKGTEPKEFDTAEDRRWSSEKKEDKEKDLIQFFEAN